MRLYDNGMLLPLLEYSSVCYYEVLSCHAAFLISPTTTDDCRTHSLCVTVNVTTSIHIIIIIVITVISCCCWCILLAGQCVVSDSSHNKFSIPSLGSPHHTLQPFYSLFSGITQVSQCQKRTSGHYGARED